MNTQPLSANPWPKWFGHFALMAGLAFLIYLPAIRSGFIWDDDVYVTANNALRTWRGLWEIWFDPFRLPQYYPLTFTSLWVDFHLWNLNPLGYHLINVLLHSMNAFLVWKLLARLKIPGAAVAALIFLVHPVHVESVAWITERKNVLSGFFYLSAFLAYLRFKDGASLREGVSGSGCSGHGRLFGYLLSFFFFLCALLSKTVTATFPAAVVLVLWWKNGRFPMKDLLRMLPFLLSGLLLGSVTTAFENAHMITLGTNEWSFTFAERVLIAGRALWFYLGKLAWPHPSTLAFIYPRWEIDPSALGQWLFPLAFLLFGFFLWKFRSKIGRAPCFVWAIFGATLFPALGFQSFFPMRYSFVADHFQYLASIAPIALAAAWIRKKQEPVSRPRYFLAVFLLALLSLLTFGQCRSYKNAETLWRDTLSKNPGSWMAHLNLAVFLIDNQRPEEALPHLNESIRLHPNNSNAYSNLGALAAARKDYEEAARFYRQALAYRPTADDIHNNFGVSLFDAGKTDEAIEHYQKAIDINPYNALAFCNLGNALFVKGEIVEAIRLYRNAIRLDPEYAAAHMNLGLALFKTGQPDQAIEIYKKAIRLAPSVGKTHHNLANVLESIQEKREAEYHRREAVRLEPENTEFRNRLGALLERLNKQEEAIQQYNEVLQRDPKNKDAQRNLLRIAFRKF